MVHSPQNERERSHGHSGAEPAEQQVIIRLELSYPLSARKSIINATEAAKSLVEFAREHGEVNAVMVCGRQKFPIS